MPKNLRDFLQNYAGDERVVTNPDMGTPEDRARRAKQRMAAPVMTPNEVEAINQRRDAETSNAEVEKEAAKMERFKQISNRLLQEQEPSKEPVIEQQEEQKPMSESPYYDAPEVARQRMLQQDEGHRKAFEQLKRDIDRDHPGAEHFQEYDKEGNLVTRNVAFPDGKTYTYIEDPDHPGEGEFDYMENEDDEGGHPSEDLEKDPRFHVVKDYLIGE
jgi:hypothetical protein